MLNILKELMNFMVVCLDISDPLRFREICESAKTIPVCFFTSFSALLLAPIYDMNRSTLAKLISSKEVHTLDSQDF